jgi:hypothetical protein
VEPVSGFIKLTYLTAIFRVRDDGYIFNWLATKNESGKEMARLPSSPQP